MDKYKIYGNYLVDEENAEKFLSLRQDNNEIIIPHHKLKKVIHSLNDILNEMELDNETNS